MNEKLMNLSLDKKVDKSKEIILEAIERFGDEKTAIAWTSGKDSTALLNLVREAFNNQVPIPVLFVDTGKHFDTVYKFRDKLVKKWNLNIINAMNNEVLNASDKGIVITNNLSEEMREEFIKKIKISLKKQVITLIPCYCEVLQSRRASIFSIENPEHHFTKSLHELSKKLS